MHLLKLQIASKLLFKAYVTNFQSRILSQHLRLSPLKVTVNACHKFCNSFFLTKKLMKGLKETLLLLLTL